MKIKPTGLKGNDKIQRIQNLMGRMNSLNESVSNSSLEHVKYGADGTAYAIVRESHTYFIKTSDKKDQNLIVDDFEYIGGLQNKMSESYKSYEEALKHLNMKFKNLNESYGIRENIDLFRSDLLTEAPKKGEVMMDEQEEETKFKLKVDAPEVAPVEMAAELPSTDMANDTSMDVSTEIPTEEPAETETPEETEISSDESETEEESGDLEKDIQRLTGKIGQKMRELDEPNPELEKYVINSIMSALDVDSMDEDFKEDLISKLEGEDEESTDKETSKDEMSTKEEPTQDETPDMEETSTEEETEEVKTESRVISKKTLLENLKKRKLKEYFYFDEESEEMDELPKKSSKKMNNKDTFYGKFSNQDDKWIGNVTHYGGKLDDTNDWDEEEFENYEEFSKKYPEHTWFSGSHNPEGSKRMFNIYKDKFGPLSIRKKTKMENDEEMLDEETVEVFTPEQLVAKLNSTTPPKGNVVVKDKVGRMKGINFNEQEEEDEIEETIYEIELDEELFGNQSKLDLNKNKKLDKDDFRMLRSKKRKMMDEDDDMDFDFDKEELKPLHKKPFDLKSVKKQEEELDEDFDLDFYTDMDDNDIADQLEIKSNKPTIAPPPVKTPTPTTPRRDRPFKPQIKPKIQPKGYRD
jgi:hypothetical protein